MNVSQLISEMITLVIMAFALGMDAFSVGLGMGLIRLRFRQIFLSVYGGLDNGGFDEVRRVR